MDKEKIGSPPAHFHASREPVQSERGCILSAREGAKSDGFRHQGAENRKGVQRLTAPKCRNNGLSKGVHSIDIRAALMAALHIVLRHDAFILHPLLCQEIRGDGLL